MQVLLEKISIVDLKYRKLKDNGSFNIFSLLREKSDEVNLHSKFLAELLNPNGIHGFEGAFLHNFLDVIDIKTFDVTNVEVYRERGKIDILIQNRKSSQAIIIENKIWASDQERQLERYYEYVKRNGFKDIWLIYLTLDGREPSIESIGLLSKPITDHHLFTISYIVQISNWLERMISVCARDPILRENLIQYKNLIHELTGQTMNNEEKQEIYMLLAERDHILEAQKIAENWVHVKWHIEDDFWNDLEEVIKQEYVILQDQKYSPAKLSIVVHNSRNRNPWYGFMFRIGTIGSDDICLFIERGFEELYYGVTAMRSGNRKISKELQTSTIAKKISEFSEWESGDLWLGGKWVTPYINFEKLSDEHTLRLINKDYRQRTIQNIWSQIQQYVLQVQCILNK